MPTIVPATGGAGAFHDTQFPPQISYGATGGPEFKTTVLVLGSGQEKRNIEWSLPRGRWNIATGLRSRADFEVFQQFFYARMGRLNGFRFKDWSDYQIVQQVFAVGDGRATITSVAGVSETFQLYKEYPSGGYSYLRPILKPVQSPANGTKVVRVNGVAWSEGTGSYNYSLDYTTGLLTLHTPDAPLPAGTLVEISYMEFDVPARFDVDKLDMNLASYQYAEWANVPVVELKGGQ